MGFQGRTQLIAPKVYKGTAQACTLFRHVELCEDVLYANSCLYEACSVYYTQSPRLIDMARGDVNRNCWQAPGCISYSIILYSQRGRTRYQETATDSVTAVVILWKLLAPALYKLMGSTDKQTDRTNAVQMGAVPCLALAARCEAPVPAET